MGWISRCYDDEACSETPKIFFAQKPPLHRHPQSVGGEFEGVEPFPRSWVGISGFQGGLRKLNPSFPLCNTIKQTEGLGADEHERNNKTVDFDKPGSALWVSTFNELKAFAKCETLINVFLCQLMRYWKPTSNENIILIGLQCKRGVKNCITINWVNGTEKKREIHLIKLCAVSSFVGTFPSLRAFLFLYCEAHGFYFRRSISLPAWWMELDNRQMSRWKWENSEGAGVGCCLGKWGGFVYANGDVDLRAVVQKVWVPVGL